MSIFHDQEVGATGAQPKLPITSPENIPRLMCTAPTSKAATCKLKLDPHSDARAIIRLIQCSQCSLPITNALTLPCGNSVCRKCIPELRHRSHVSSLDTTNRSEVFTCPFSNCGWEHVLADCSQDVVLARLMMRVGIEVAKHRSINIDTPTKLEEQFSRKSGRDSVNDKEMQSTRILNGGRLLATYTLSELGQLGFDSEVVYQTMSPIGDLYERLDASILDHLKEATRSEMDCQVCYALIYDPVTTPCGHTFCRHCVARILDHSPLCPMCRRPLRLPPGAKGAASNRRLKDLLLALCPDLVSERADQLEEEIKVQGDSNIPLFVCTNGFPSMPTFLHIFEPRYRLMIRRTIESGENKFGIITYNRRMEPQGGLGPTQFMQYGTMLHINTVQMTNDGRSMVDTRGIYRFRVKSWSMLDGYVVGTIERISDVSGAEEEALEAQDMTLPPAPSSDLAMQIDRMPTIDLLHICLDFVRRMRALSAPWLRGAHYESYGEMPDDPALFPYWFASILPISEEEKYKLLPTTSVRERLKITTKWVKKIEGQRCDYGVHLVTDSEDDDDSGFATDDSDDTDDEMPGLISDDEIAANLHMTQT